MKKSKIIQVNAVLHIFPNHVLILKRTIDIL